MTTAPTWETAKDYLGGDETSWTDEEITAAFTSEAAAQARVIRFDLDDADAVIWSDDRVEALCRRVAHNLALRGLPLGVQASMTDSAVATNNVGGTDAEVRRLEKPYRKLPVG